MKNVLLTMLHLAVMAAKLCGPGGVRAVIAENLVLKQLLHRHDPQLEDAVRPSGERRRDLRLNGCAMTHEEASAERQGKAAVHAVLCQSFHWSVPFRTSDNRESCAALQKLSP